MKEEKWYLEEHDEEEENDYVVTEYEITAAPNDFNVRTLFDFLESGVIKIPGFQRNFVWDIKRASKLIESVIIGLPIPQIFLYEESRNKFLVIDGQQRLMSLYYFIKQRFPKKEVRSELREIFDKENNIPDHILKDDKYFNNFNLKLPERLPDKPNKFNKKNYSTLAEYKTSFELRTIRNIIIKQNEPNDDNTSMFEIFNRLNTGGLNLKPQEIRSSLFHSDFYEMLYRINQKPKWRNLLGQPHLDVQMKDIEVLLRGFAMLYEGDIYKPSMTKFLNQFSKKRKQTSSEIIVYLEQLFDSFLESCSSLDPTSLFSKGGRFNLSVFESVFTAVCKPHLTNKTLVVEKIDPNKIEVLKKDKDFIAATQSNTTSKENVKVRLGLAKSILMPESDSDE